jgi:hypothetical protein
MKNQTAPTKMVRFTSTNTITRRVTIGGRGAGWSLASELFGIGVVAGGST